MSRIYYTVEENGNIAFHKKNPLICREKIIDPADAPTKEECLEFLEYLRVKENCIVFHCPARTMFNKFDLYHARLVTLKETIKKSTTATEAYVRYAKRKNIGCVNKQVRASLGAEIWYREDFYEYLISIGYEREKALLFTELVYKGEYKNYSKVKRNENLSRYSQQLHEFALAVVLPCRDTLFREFSYEYSLFSRMKEKELINSIADKSERSRMNALRLIENDEVRERLNNERHTFASSEAALIAHNCRWLTIEEKHKEWERIILNIPDTALDIRFMSSEGIASVHNLLAEMIIAENEFLTDFRRDIPGLVYTVERLKNPERENSSFLSELIGVFVSLPSFYEAYKSMSEPSELTAGFVVKRFSLDVPQNHESVYMDSTLNILRIVRIGSTHTRLNFLEQIIDAMQHDNPDFLSFLNKSNYPENHPKSIDYL